MIIVLAKNFIEAKEFIRNQNSPHRFKYVSSHLKIDGWGGCEYIKLEGFKQNRFYNEINDIILNPIMGFRSFEKNKRYSLKNKKLNEIL